MQIMTSYREEDVNYKVMRRIDIMKEDRENKGFAKKCLMVPKLQRMFPRSHPSHVISRPRVARAGANKLKCQFCYRLILDTNYRQSNEI